MTEASDSERQERKSAFTVGAVLLLIAAWNAWRGRPMVYWPTGLVGVALLLTGLLWAAGSSKFHSLWMRLAHALGYVNSRIQCCPGKVAPTDGKSLPLNVLWPILPGNDLKSRGRKWPPERSIPTRHNGG